jgi:formamidopyrimidine-DNA glycosylase
MPELPDVESIRQELEGQTIGKRIVDVVVNSPSLVDGTAHTTLQNELRGRAIDSAGRHGKHLFIGFNEWEKELAVHFGMTGSLRYFEDIGDDPVHDRIRFDFSDSTHMAYDSVRKLGRIQLVDDRASFIAGKGLGPDALDQVTTFDDFVAAVGTRRGMAKAVLMDQKVIAGIGNVYSDEILFQARVNPKSRVDAMGEDLMRVLFDAMRNVLRTAIENGADPDRLPRDFLIHQRHAGGVCPVCGGSVRKEKIAGRSSYFCPNCQRR